MSGLRDIPSVDRVLSHSQVRGLVEEFSHEWVVSLVRQRLDEGRIAASTGKQVPSVDEIAESVVQRANSLGKTWPQPLINATGVIIHTNLGRAPLSDEAIDAVVQVSRGYTNLELDLAAGKRGSRQAHVQALLAYLTGAEAVLVVNNNASAVLLGLTALAKGREVIVSRGEAVEIGGGFRIPEVLAQSGAILKEVGTTNRTYVSDYEAAITENTAAILKVHPSNFRVAGFIHSPEVSELVGMASKHKLSVLYDLGSGCLLNTEAYGLAHEPTPQESISAGVSLVFFSGDKLLGGPQAGIVVGKRELVARLERHPLARAVRIDKLSLATLSATLLHYVKDKAVEKIPVWRMIKTSLEELEVRARRWQAAIGERARVRKSLSTVGGGSLPGETLPTWVVCIQCSDLPGGADGLMQRLREQQPPVIGRTEEDEVVLDPRTVMTREEDRLLAAVMKALGVAPLAGHR